MFLIEYPNTLNFPKQFTAIESILEPLFAYDKFIFNDKLKSTNQGEEAVNQFLFFSRKVDPNRKDDIPDACSKGASLLNRNYASVSSGWKNMTEIIHKPKRISF